jgi:hypothetical protein
MPVFCQRLIHDKDTGRPREFSKMRNAKYSGADMTNETMKALLMILIIGGLQAAIHMPKISQPWAFLVRAMAYVQSALILTDRALQPAFIKRQSDNRQR